MRLDDVAKFIGANKTVFRFVLPEVGSYGANQPVYLARARGNKIAWAERGHDGLDAFEVNGAYVRDIMPGDDAIRLTIDEAFPIQAIDVRKVMPQDAVLMSHWDEGFAIFDDDDEIAERAVIDFLGKIEKPIDPKPDTRITTARFGAWWNGVAQPYGVLSVDDSGALVAMGFPGREAEAATWTGRFTEVSEDFLSSDDFQELIGRSEFVEAPEWSTGTDRVDAMVRALHAYGADYYSETGRSLF